jgi:hypothetical protein
MNNGTLTLEAFKHMSNLELTIVYDNVFVGSIPKSLGSCTKHREILLGTRRYRREAP